MPKSLTPKQEAFAVAYIKTGNASEAYREAYAAGKMTPESINVAACRALKNAKVALRIDELRAPALAAAEMTIQRTIQEAAHVCFSDVGDLLDDDGKLVPIRKLPRHVRAAISSVKFDKDTGKISEIKLWDKNSGLEKAFKHLGLFREDNDQKRENLVIQVQVVNPP